MVKANPGGGEAARHFCPEQAADFMGIKAALNDMRDNLNASILRYAEKHRSYQRCGGVNFTRSMSTAKILGRALIGKEAAELTQRNGG